MKKIFCIIYILFSCFPLKAQEENVLNNIINSSIKSYISHENDFRDHHGIKNRKHFYICADGLPQNFPYDSLKNVTFCSLKNVEGMSRKWKKKLNKGFGVLFISIYLKYNELIITISDKNVKRTKKRHIQLATIQWGDFIYKYCCENQKWEQKNIIYSGV